MRTPRLLLAVALLALVWPAAAAAKGGRYSFDGGTPKQQAQVRVALEASTFDWSIVPDVVIHLAQGTDTYATRGHIWIDTDLLTSGVFAWGAIQHEYAHQVDFFLLDDAKRAVLARELGSKVWFDEPGHAHYKAGLRHRDFGCERFASTLAWAYWQVPENSMRPRSARDEAAAVEPARFRALLAKLLGVKPATGTRVVVVR